MPDLAAGVGIALTKEADTDVLRISTNTVSGRLIAATWADLSAVVPDGGEGTAAEVPTTDTGTHTDPVVGGTVNNTGIFRYSESPAGWERIADVEAVSVTGLLGGAGVSAQQLKDWTSAESYESTSLTRDSNGIVTSATVKWPDGSAGTFTATTINATWLAIDAFTITHADSSKTVTQAAVTRNSNGEVTAKPALTVA